MTTALHPLDFVKLARDNFMSAGHAYQDHKATHALDLDCLTCERLATHKNNMLDLSKVISDHVLGNPEASSVASQVQRKSKFKVVK